MDKNLADLILRDSESDQLPADALAGMNKASPMEDFGLDGTGDFDISALEGHHILAIEEKLEEDPELMLASARAFWDADITHEELRAKLQLLRAHVEHPEAGAGALKASHSFEAVVGMPPGWGFEGYEPTEIPIRPQNTKFETMADAMGYVAAWVGATRANFFKPKAHFPRHSSDHPFVYDVPSAKTRIGLFGDFGNGLSHSRYIAKHLRNTALDHLIYVGDVYYCGTTREFASYVAREMEPLLTGDTPAGHRVNLMMLNSNHEMFSKGYSYFSYMRYRLAKGLPQRQQGSYFALQFGDTFQIIALDTDYHRASRMTDAGQLSWLKQRLLDGRRRGAINILLTANEPYSYGKHRVTKLYTDLKPYLSMVDFWAWGNTHYCGLFDRTDNLPIGTCIGHGGYPYRLAEQRLDRDLYLQPCPADPLFLETRSRYYGTKLRSELGNNGYLLMNLDCTNKRIELEYIDWRKNPRYKATLAADASGRLAVLHGEEV